MIENIIGEIFVFLLLIEIGCIIWLGLNVPPNKHG
jgi:hypothetical protein